MSGSQSAADRLEELQARVDDQAAQLRLLWGPLVYGCTTLAVCALDPEIAAFFGTIGFVAAIALGLLYLSRWRAD